MCEVAGSCQLVDRITVRRCAITTKVEGKSNEGGTMSLDVTRDATRPDSETPLGTASPIQSRVGMHDP